MNAPVDSALQAFVLSETCEGVATLTLNRGDRFNPLSQAMVAALQAELDRLALDTAARVVVIAGRGKGFCAGHDLKELRAHAEPPDSAWQQEMFDACSRMMLTLTRLPQPVIARVHGVATAAGCQLVSMCDLAVASENARFALPGVNVGIFCTTPAVGVARNVARKRAMEMLLTGEMIDARTALNWGLVNKVVPESELDAAVAHFTGIIRARSATVVALGKRAFYGQLERDIEGAYALADGVMACNMLEPDAREGIDAFLGKRAPEWNG
ncbi:MAG TPA: enoyl-CoA hydratase [Casimicrobiaceae bacterium]|jgi:enoyl-CoA hydratase/carnithine racemase|nr:enoyl-CoA hydratase [Casimicrobiaceae bacterium]